MERMWWSCQDYPRTIRIIQGPGITLQVHPRAVRVHPTTRDDPHRIIQELSGLSNNQGEPSQDHPKDQGWPSRIIQDLSGFIQQPGMTLQVYLSKDQDGPQKFIQGLSGSSRSCQGSSNNQGEPSQDHPRIVRIIQQPVTEDPHRIIQRTRDDPLGSSKNCQGSSNNQWGPSQDHPKDQG